MKPKTLPDDTIPKTEFIIIAEYDDGAEITFDVLATSEEEAVELFYKRVGYGCAIVDIEHDYETIYDAQKDEEVSQPDTVPTTSVDAHTETLTNELEAAMEII